MQISKIREFLNLMPFKPFVLQLSSGRTLEVPHPEFMAISPDEREVFVFLPEEMTLVDINHVSEVSYPKKRGRKRGAVRK